MLFGDQFHRIQSQPHVIPVRWSIALACLLPGMAMAGVGAAPILYSQASFESPVRAQPDELLLLAGYGFAAGDTVVYRSLSDTNQLPPPPHAIPDAPTADVGYAPVVGRKDPANALTVRLPAVLRAGQAYVLWVRAAAGEWSNPVRINDVRPLWLSPAFVYRSWAPAGLPHSLKVMGRNMDPAPGQRTLLRLTGPVTRRLVSIPSSAALAPYVAEFPLPPALPPGRYRVSVARDGRSWVTLADQVFEVRAAPAAEREFAISDPVYGGCKPGGSGDATPCVIKAIAAAQAAGGGAVRFGRGTWHLTDSTSPGVTPVDGIVVPEGVTLRGSGPALTRVIRDPQWNMRSPTAAFTLRGHNIVQGFTFADLQVYTPASGRTGFFLQVGQNSDQLWVQSHGAPTPTAREVLITHNRFDKTDTAVGAGGIGIEELFITYNEFGTYRNALEIGGNLFNMTNRFRVDDSVIEHNTFYPSSYLQAAEHLGPIASELGAAHRLDFSDNFADGAATEALYSPDDPRGWRAGFFWHMNDSQEMLLISNNVATCTGDKTGDGEAIALDNSGNTFAFDGMRTVRAASVGGVTVDGGLAGRQFDRDVPLDRYYVGHWMQVGDGPGMGQVRRITSYRVDAASGRVTFDVAPGWDVTPVTGISRISVGREFWQVLVIGNTVDHRTPLCRKSNRSRPVGGAIVLWAQMADSVVAGNRQYDTDGVEFHENYDSAIDQCHGCGVDTFYQSFVDIRDNLVDGKYDNGSDCRESGIRGGVSASPGGREPPPTLGFGITIAGNRLRHAENTLGGAIYVEQGWYDGPAPHAWPLLENLIVQHNVIEGELGPIIGRACSARAPRRGLSFPGSPLAWHSVLYANSCTGDLESLGPGGRETVPLCPDGTTHSCECAAAQP